MKTLVLTLLLLTSCSHNKEVQECWTRTEVKLKEPHKVYMSKRYEQMKYFQECMSMGGDE